MVARQEELNNGKIAAKEWLLKFIFWSLCNLSRYIRNFQFKEIVIF